ncbi:MAG: hypothetical protein Q8R39_03210 [bacterium]|nr:hypothetical protein [bacterium]MDZ4285084.1 hypothetical protein [Patescibacteria group bacterium]
MSTLKRLVKKFLRACGRRYYRTLSLPAMWRFRNRAAIRRYRSAPPIVSDVGRAIIGELERTGIAVTRADALLGGKRVVELIAYARERWESPAVRARAERSHDERAGESTRAKSYFLVNLWEGPAVLDFAHPFTRFSLDEAILGTVAGYLGMWPKFRGWALEATVPMPTSRDRFASQRWHRDPEDQKLVKVFLYLNDVDEDAGPFTYVQFSHSGGKWRSLFAQEPPAGSPKMPPDADNFIPSEDIRVCTGAAGTIVFCDTSGLHRGGFARERERLMYTSIYTPPGSFTPISYSYPEYFSASSHLSSLQRFALENDPHQREPRWH